MSTVTYYGKYRAQVVDVKDPEERGRIRVLCPKVLGNAKSAWCDVCVPVASDNEGDFCLPKVGEFVWVEFEEGNPNRPIYLGGWYSKSKSPQTDYKTAPDERIISFKGNKISMKENQCKVSISKESVELSITNAQISLNFKNKAKITLQSSNIVVEFNGVSCSLTADSLTKLKTLIGG